MSSTQNVISSAAKLSALSEPMHMRPGRSRLPVIQKWGGGFRAELKLSCQRFSEGASGPGADAVINGIGRAAVTIWLLTVWPDEIVWVVMPLPSKVEDRQAP